MKKILFLLFALFLCLITNAQTVKEGFNGYGDITTVTGDGPTYTLTISNFNGSPRFQPYGTWNGSDVLVNDVIWIDCARFIVTDVVSSGFNNMIVDVEVPSEDWSEGVSSPLTNQRIAVVRELAGNLPALPPSGDGNGGTLSGIDNNLYSCMVTHYTRALNATYDINPSDDILNVSNTLEIVMTKTGQTVSSQLSQQGAAINQVLKWNGTRWAPATDETSSGGSGGAPDDATYLVLGTTVALTNERVLTFDNFIFQVTDTGPGGTYTVTILDEAITEEMIKNGAVTSAKLADLAVTNAKLAANSVSTEKVQNLSITPEKLANGNLQRFTPTSGNTVTATGTLPTDLTKILVTRNGVKYDLGTTGCTGCHVSVSGNTFTFSRNFVSGEEIIIKF